MRPGVALALVVTALAGMPPRAGADDGAASYFPLHAGSWWAYEERGQCGQRLAREIWTMDVRDVRYAGEVHVRASMKRLDTEGGELKRRWEVHEFLRVSADGVRKRYPGRDAETEILLVKEPARPGTHWRDAQGRCEVTAQGTPCQGPPGPVADCLVVVCRLGEPTATIVTSVYARGIGMVRQEIEVLQLGPTFAGGPHGEIIGPEPMRGGRSVLELVRYHVGP